MKNVIKSIAAMFNQPKNSDMSISQQITDCNYRIADMSETIRNGKNLSDAEKQSLKAKIDAQVSLARELAIKEGV